MPSPVRGVPHVVESCQRWLRSYLHEFPFCISATDQYTPSCFRWRYFGHFFQVFLAKMPSGCKRGLLLMSGAVLEGTFGGKERYPLTMERHEGATEWVAKDRQTRLSRRSSSTLRRDTRRSNSGSQIVGMMNVAQPGHRYDSSINAGTFPGLTTCASPKFHPGGKRPDRSRPYVLNFRACD